MAGPSWEKQDLQKMILASKAGDKLAREKIIAKYKPYVYKIVSKICGQFISPSDDEASVGLIAFNEAIDDFTPEKGVSFFSFARIVIKRRLIDFFRKERKAIATLSCLGKNGENVLDQIDFEQAHLAYKKEQEAKEREEEILAYQIVLQKYGISFQDLLKVSPKHRDARMRAMEVASIIAGDDFLKDHLLSRKELPLKALTSKVQVSRKTLERQRKFIIALAIILIYEFPMLKEYIDWPEKRGEKYD